LGIVVEAMTRPCSSLHDANVAVIVSFTERLAWVRESRNITVSSR
jgi:hypothetical protein